MLVYYKSSYSPAGSNINAVDSLCSGMKPTFAFLLITASACAQQLTSKLSKVTDFGPNPRNVSMNIYIPANLPPNAPICSQVPSQ